VREAVSMNPADSSTVVRVRDGQASEWRELVVFPYGEGVGVLTYGEEGSMARVS
jgi:hypothetical protein